MHCHKQVGGKDCSIAFATAIVLGLKDYFLTIRDESPYGELSQQRWNDNVSLQVTSNCMIDYTISSNLQTWLLFVHSM